MSHEDVFKVLRDIAAADAMSYWIVGALTLVVFVVMRAMLPVKSLANVFAPAVFCGGLAGIYTAATWGLVASTEKTVNVTVWATLGMMVALLAMIALVRLVDAVTRIRTPLTNAAPR
ncbi:hypothetical protein [Hyphomicrobium sp.]|uniref:hypothetical protein n=1 Tax=Hyphomicrobium sp. TaxID=82 RepID=UPI0025C0FDC1|nr:hypothetical protein [Hyphomicrobium sp.]MCC7251194.1 hypothetical protein [Hyphomicrobium sp.]